MKTSYHDYLELYFHNSDADYYKYLQKKAEGITIASAKETEQILHEIGVTAYTLTEIKSKQCFRNSALIAHLCKGVNYVEGDLLYDSTPGLHIDHAWNEYKGKHFDITRYVFDSFKDRDEYTKLEIFTSQQLAKLSKKYGHAPYLRSIYEAG